MAGKRISAKEVLSKYVQTHAQAGLRGSKESRGSKDGEERDPLSGVTMKSRKEGYFYKRGEFFDSWQKRYFLLLKDKLNYYKSPPQNDNAKALGTIDLAVVTNVALDVDKSENSFALYTPQRCYMLRTDTLQERADWVAVITHNWVRSLRSMQKRRITEKNRESETERMSISTSQSVSKQMKLSSSILRNSEMLKTANFTPRPLSPSRLTVSPLDSPSPSSLSSSPSRSPSPSPSPSSSASSLFATPSSVSSSSSSPTSSFDSPPSSRRTVSPAYNPSFISSTSSIEVKINDDDAAREGYIWKIGGDSITGHWQKRWFSLRHSTLTYFKTKKGSTVRGTIDLAKVLSVELDTVKSKQFSWSVVTATRIYFLASDSNEERDGWVVVIRGLLQQPVAAKPGATPELVSKNSVPAAANRKRATAVESITSASQTKGAERPTTNPTATATATAAAAATANAGKRQTNSSNSSKKRSDEDEDEEEENEVMDSKMVDEILEKQGIFDDALIAEYDSEESDFNVSVHEGFHDYYEFGETIGEGGFSKVLKGRHRVTDEKFAVKWISKSSLDDLVYLKREISLMKQMDHPNVVKLYEVWEDPDDFFLVMELVSGVEVFEMVTQMGKYSEVHAHHIIKQLIEVMDFLHNTVGIAHRDIKPENILTSGEKEKEILKLIDFGLAKKFGIVKRHRLATRVGTPCYLAPEVVSSSDSEYSQAVDMWSVGVLIYILLSGYHPFIAFDLNIDRVALEERIKKVQFDFGHPVWNKVSDSAKELIRKLITKDPKARYTAKQALLDPWVKGEVPLASQQLNNTMLRQTSDILKKMKKTTDAFAPPASLVQEKK